MRRALIFEEKGEDMIKEYESGQTIGQLAKKYNVSYTAMKNFLKMNNVKLRRRVQGIRSILWNRKEDVIKEYESGQTLFGLAKTYNVSHTTIMNFLKTNNVKLRRRGRKSRITKKELIKYANLIKERKMFLYQAAYQLNVSEGILREMLRRENLY